MCTKVAHPFLHIQFLFSEHNTNLRCEPEFFVDPAKRKRINGEKRERSYLFSKYATTCFPSKGPTTSTCFHTPITLVLLEQENKGDRGGINGEKRERERERERGDLGKNQCTCWL